MSMSILIGCFLGALVTLFVVAIVVVIGVLTSESDPVSCVFFRPKEYCRQEQEPRLIAAPSPCSLSFCSSADDGKTLFFCFGCDNAMLAGRHVRVYVGEPIDVSPIINKCRVRDGGAPCSSRSNSEYFVPEHVSCRRVGLLLAAIVRTRKYVVVYGRSSTMLAAQTRYNRAAVGSPF